MKPRSKPLKCVVTRDGVLRIEIGIDALAKAFKYSQYAYDLCGFPHVAHAQPQERIAIDNPRGFAVDVRRELLREREDGSSLLTDMFDAAEKAAVEDGSEFVDVKESK